MTIDDITKVCKILDKKFDIAQSKENLQAMELIVDAKIEVVSLFVPFERTIIS